VPARRVEQRMVGVVAVDALVIVVVVAARGLLASVLSATGLTA